VAASAVVVLEYPLGGIVDVFERVEGIAATGYTVEPDMDVEGLQRCEVVFV